MISTRSTAFPVQRKAEVTEAGTDFVVLQFYFRIRHGEQRVMQVVATGTQFDNTFHKLIIRRIHAGAILSIMNQAEKFVFR